MLHMIPVATGNTDEILCIHAPRDTIDGPQTVRILWIAMLSRKVKACNNILTARSLRFSSNGVLESLDQRCPALLYFLMHALSTWWWETLCV